MSPNAATSFAVDIQPGTDSFQHSGLADSGRTHLRPGRSRGLRSGSRSVCPRRPCGCVPSSSSARIEVFCTNILTKSSVPGDLLGRAPENRGIRAVVARPGGVRRFVAEPGPGLEREGRARNRLAGCRRPPAARRLESMQIRSSSRPAPRSYSAAPLLAITVGWAPGRSLITSSQRTGRPVAKMTGMPARCAASTAVEFCSTHRPVGLQEGAVQIGDDQFGQLVLSCGSQASRIIRLQLRPGGVARPVSRSPPASARHRRTRSRSATASRSSATLTPDGERAGDGDPTRRGRPGLWRR